MGMLEVQNSLIGYEPCCPRAFFDLTGKTTRNPWKQITIRKIKTVASKFVTFGRFCRQKASRRARTLSVRVISRWKRAITAPSNSAPRPLLIVVGLKAFQMMFSLPIDQNNCHYLTVELMVNPEMRPHSPDAGCQIVKLLQIFHVQNDKLIKKIPEKEPDAHQILVAMKREIPEPSPYPFCRSSSKHITMIPAKQS